MNKENYGETKVFSTETGELLAETQEKIKSPADRLRCFRIFTMILGDKIPKELTKRIDKEEKELKDLVSEYNSLASETKKIELDEEFRKINQKAEENISHFKPEALEQIKTMLKDDEGNALSVIYWIASSFRSEDNKDVVISLDTIKSVAQYSQVRYGGKEAVEYISKNPQPTAYELMLGVYEIEIEKQVRKALRILRGKGYQTVESGYVDYLNGKQFFHFNHSIKVPEEAIRVIGEKYGVHVIPGENYSDNYVFLESPKDRVLSLAEWESVQTDFVNLMPVIDRKYQMSHGGGIEFIIEALNKYKKEDILATATTDNEKAFVEWVYSLGIEGLIKFKEAEFGD